MAFWGFLQTAVKTLRGHHLKLAENLRIWGRPGGSRKWSRGVLADPMTLVRMGLARGRENIDSGIYCFPFLFASRPGSTCR